MRSRNNLNHLVRKIHEHNKQGKIGNQWLNTSWKYQSRKFLTIQENKWHKSIMRIRHSIKSLLTMKREISLTLITGHRAKQVFNLRIRNQIGLLEIKSNRMKEDRYNRTTFRKLVLQECQQDSLYQVLEVFKD